MQNELYRKYFVGIASVILAMVVLCIPAAAQCPLCRLSVQSSSQAGAMQAGLNLGILVLLVPPVTIFCSIFFVALKHRKSFKS
jgi:hypothetical protein